LILSVSLSDKMTSINQQKTIEMYRPTTFTLLSVYMIYHVEN
jgi:hypothetical protein